MLSPTMIQVTDRDVQEQDPVESRTHSDGLDVSPTQPMPWRQEDARTFIQKQEELKELFVVFELTAQVGNRTYETTPPDVDALVSGYTWSLEHDLGQLSKQKLSYRRKVTCWACSSGCEGPDESSSQSSRRQASRGSSFLPLCRP